MKRTSTNLIIDSIAFVAFILLTTTGVLMKYMLPPGSGHHTTIWNMDRHEWGDIHLWLSVIFFSVIGVHVVLHWRWIVNVFSRVKTQTKESGYRAILGLVGLITVLALAVSPLFSPIEKQASVVGTPQNSTQNDRAVQGSMTLMEVEELYGVPGNYIIESLNLSSNTSLNEKLGVLKREYGFTMEDVRRLVDEYESP